MLSKLKRAFENPELARTYLYNRYDSYVIRPIKGNYVDWRASNSGQYTVKLDGYDLLVNLNDGGIGRDLAIHGIREPISYNAYRKQLRELYGSPDEPVRVLEVGANIGYYALAPAVDIDQSMIYAVEVDASNVELLRQNVQKNNVNDKFNIDCVALGSENTEAEVYKSGHSNLHSLQRGFAKSKPELHTETESTHVVTGSKLLSNYDVLPSDMEVLRMDVEGYEANILRGLPDILSSPPLLIHMEIHPKLMPQEDIEYLRSRLDEINIVCAARGRQSIDINNVDELLSYPWIEFVGKVSD